MDTRAIIAGTVAITSIICATVLAALGNTDTTQALVALAGTSVAYAVGLLSEPRTNTSNDASPNANESETGDGDTDA